MGLQQQEELQAPEQAALKLQNKVKTYCAYQMIAYLCVFLFLWITSVIFLFLSKAWLVWKEMHKAACSERAKESKAVFFFTARLKKQMFSHWISYTCHRKTKKTAQGISGYISCIFICFHIKNILELGFFFVCFL